MKKSVIVWILVGLFSFAIIGSGIAKFARPDELVQNFTKWNLEGYITLFGIMELVFVALFIYPKTRYVGFFLLCSYFGGAIATDLSHGNPIIAPVVILSGLWLTMFVQDKNIFFKS